MSLYSHKTGFTETCDAICTTCGWLAVVGDAAAGADSHVHQHPGHQTYVAQIFAYTTWADSEPTSVFVPNDGSRGVADRPRFVGKL